MPGVFWPESGCSNTPLLIMQQKMRGASCVISKATSISRAVVEAISWRQVGVQLSHVGVEETLESETVINEAGSLPQSSLYGTVDLVTDWLLATLRRALPQFDQLLEEFVMGAVYSSSLELEHSACALRLLNDGGCLRYMIC